MELNFNPRTPCGVRPGGDRPDAQRHGISIHAPLAGCDGGPGPESGACSISIHAPLAGCDPFHFPVFGLDTLFQSTHPLRGATLTLDHNFRADIISIHAPLAGCDALPGLWHRRLESFQSTHPLRGATGRVHGREAHPGFQSTHPLRGATNRSFRRLMNQLFQSTHPLRGATGHKCPRMVDCKHFNPRTPCGVRRPVQDGVQPVRQISIHAPLAGCDVVDVPGHDGFPGFQSTHPLRGATP